MEQLLENFRLDVFDVNFARLGHLYIVMEHGGKDGAPGRKYVDMPANLFASFEIKLDVALILLDVQLGQLFQSRLLSRPARFKLDPKHAGYRFPDQPKSETTVEFFRFPGMIRRRFG